MSDAAQAPERGGPMYSVWLLPAEPLASLLRAQVAALASEFGTPPFPPHVTLQGDLALPLAQVVRATAALAQTLQAQHWTVHGIDTAASHWRSFHVVFAAASAFAPALAQLAALTGSHDALSPFAHLSLAYGPLADARKAELRARVLPQLPPLFAFDRLAVALSGKTVGVPSWRTLQTFALARAPHQP
jgi:hypothetical protein